MSFFNYSNYYDAVASKLQFHTYVEVGCFEGESTAYLAKALKPRWRQVEIFAVDIFEGVTKEIDPIFYNRGQYWKKYEERLVNENVRKKVIDIKSLSHEGASKFKDRSVDFVFIDASNAYADVMRDMEHWWPKISGYGTLAGHDCYAPSVHSAIKDFSGKQGLNFKTYGNSVWEMI